MYDEGKTVALILAQLEPDESLTVGFGDEQGELELSPEEQLHAVAGELVEAVRCGDVAAVAESLRGAFLLLDSMPHVEGEHVAEQAEELEPEEQGHELESVAHELRERLGGWHENGDDDNGDGYGFGGTAARKRYSSGGRVRYADGGMVPTPVSPTTPTPTSQKPVPPAAAGGSPLGAMSSEELERELEKRRRQQAGGGAPGPAWMRELSSATPKPAPTLTGGQSAGGGRGSLAGRQPMR